MERINKEILVTEYMKSKNEKFALELTYIHDETLDEIIKIINLEREEWKNLNTFTSKKF